MPAVVGSVVPMRRASPNLSMRNGAKSGHRDLQPDAMGVATRLAAGRLREAGIVLRPLLRSAGLSAIQINNEQITIENAITPLLPHGKAQLGAVAQTLGVSSRTLARRLAAEGLSSPSQSDFY